MISQIINKGNSAVLKIINERKDNNIISKREAIFS